MFGVIIVLTCAFSTHEGATFRGYLHLLPQSFVDAFIHTRSPLRWCHFGGIKAFLGKTPMQTRREYPCQGKVGSIRSLKLNVTSYPHLTSHRLHLYISFLSLVIILYLAHTHLHHSHLSLNLNSSLGILHHASLNFRCLGSCFGSHCLCYASSSSRGRSR